MNNYGEQLFVTWSLGLNWDLSFVIWDLIPLQRDYPPTISFRLNTKLSHKSCSSSSSSLSE